MKKNKKSNEYKIIGYSSIILICGSLIMFYNKNVIDIVDYMINGVENDKMSDIFMPISSVLLIMFFVFLVIPFIIAMFKLLKLLITNR